MLIRYLRADFIDKAGKVQASYSFQSDSTAQARIEARIY
jgi:hypothetical protein